jgi:GTP-binding protein YchF
MEHLGLVGLPDSGHAQLFSALTGLDTPTGFETTKGVAPLPDDRVDRLAEMSKSKKLVHATFEIDFIPGLAPGGKPGEGLGRRLLGSIRDCDAILAVLRADDDGEALTDPADALTALELELVLADLASVEQRLEKQRRAMKGDSSLAAEVAALERGDAVLANGTPVYRSDLTDEERKLLAPVFLLTNKPMLVVVNVAVDRLDQSDLLAAPFGSDAISVCVEIEGDPDVAQASAEERSALLADLGVTESVLPRLARSAYHLLGRRTFFTTGGDESRAWSFRAGAKAPECAGVIHSDLQRGFIRAEVIEWRDVLDIGSWDKAKELGKLRVEGKEYEVRDGDVLEIRFNV